MAQPIPEARGFAAALETYLARGGNLGPQWNKKGDVFSQGPIRGMTVEQATAKARELWQKTPKAVRDRYARQESTLLAPSERAAAAGYRGPERGIGPEWRGRGEYSERELGQLFLPGEDAAEEARKGAEAASEQASYSGPGVDLGGRVVNPASSRGAGYGSPVKKAYDTPEAIAQGLADAGVSMTGGGGPLSMAFGGAMGAPGGDYWTKPNEKWRRTPEREARELGFGDEIDAKNAAEAKAKSEARAKAEAEAEAARVRKIRERTGLDPAVSTPENAPESSGSAYAGPTGSRDESARNAGQDAAAAAGADTSPANNDSAMTGVSRGAAGIARPDLTGAPEGMVWIGYEKDANGNKVKKYAPGDPTQGGAAPPEGYDPRSGGSYAGPDAPRVNAGEPDFVASAKENQRREREGGSSALDQLSGQKRADAERMRGIERKQREKAVRDDYARRGKPYVVDGKTIAPEGPMTAQEEFDANKAALGSVAANEALRRKGGEVMSRRLFNR